MKISPTPAIGILLLACSAPLMAKPKTVTPVKVNAALIDQKPYRYNGVVLTGEARGSGFCAWNRRTFFSAAHVPFSEGAWGAPPIWAAQQHDEEVNKAQAIRSRGYYRWVSYAELAAEPDDSIAFSKDVILAYSFNPLIKGNAAILNTNGDKDLKKKKKSMITGYPAENAYLDESLDGYFLHRTGPMIRPFSKFAGKALVTTLATTGGGNSGGPVWTQNKKKAWVASGVLVGGRPSETIVYAFSQDVKSLTRAVAPVLKKKIGAPVVANGVTGSSLFFPVYKNTVIPDGSTKWTSFRIGVDKFGSSATVKSVRLSLDIRTKHRGDLVIILEGPGGYQLLLQNEQGGDAENFILKNRNVTSKFADIPADGYWYLRVQDRLKGDVSTFKHAILEIEASDSGEEVPTP